MIDGIELAALGMDAYANVQEVIAKNLANANTAGYKKDVISFKQVLTQTNDVETSNVQTNFGIDHSKGNLTFTGNTLDMAVDGDGFFTLETDNGIRYTRNGQFQLSNTGEIVTATGAKLLGQSGPIQIPPGKREILVDSKGNIKVDGSNVGTLMITNFTDLTSLVSTGDSLFTAPIESINESNEINIKVAQGYLESSNVDIVIEMVDMIANMRSYEASNNVIKSFSDLMERLISTQSNIN
ncbi:MAG: flagellar basal-body rod protein FlgF [Candidatus Brocadiaceae bacterium]|nr:flagellar basal-body rod protein FlgF [Candidatus Brocadiaceae bacterium]